MEKLNIMKKLFTSLVITTSILLTLSAQKESITTTTTEYTQNIPKGSTVYVIDYSREFYKILWKQDSLNPVECWVGESKLLMTDELIEFKNSKESVEKKKDESKKITIPSYNCNTFPPPPYGTPSEKDTYSGDYKSITYTYYCYNGRYRSVTYSNYNCEGWEKTEYTSNCIY
jgi:hypothetical protein